MASEFRSGRPKENFAISAESSRKQKEQKESFFLQIVFQKKQHLSAERAFFCRKVLLSAETTCRNSAGTQVSMKSQGSWPAAAVYLPPPPLFPRLPTLQSVGRLSRLKRRSFLPLRPTAEDVISLAFGCADFAVCARARAPSSVIWRRHLQMRQHPELMAAAAGLVLLCLRG